MRKYMKVILLAVVSALVLAVAFGAAAEVEKRDEFVPFRIRVLEILKRHPEVLAEIEAVRAEYENWAQAEFAEKAPAPYGAARGWLGGGFCHGPGRMQRRHHMWGRW